MINVYLEMKSVVRLCLILSSIIWNISCTLPTFTLPHPSTPCSPYPGTGAYREVCSEIGYGFESAAVYLPSAAKGEIYIGEQGDTPFIYMGGYVPTAVDAGFIYSATYDNWAPFISAEKTWTLCEDIHPHCKRIPGGTSIWIAFEANQQNQTVGLYWDCDTCTGTLSFSSKNQIDVQVSQSVLKRITSIAQSHQNFGTGSNITNVQWTDCQIGMSLVDESSWDSSSTGAFVNYPDKNVVQVYWEDQSDETDNILLIE